MLARESDLDLLIRSAEAAGEIATRHWRRDHRTWDKGDGQGPVTEADLEVDTYLRETLLDARPDHGWLSEETEDTTERLGADRLFIVDPIDGTRSFAAGERTWAHSLAIAENGVVTAAVVYLPQREKLYAATLGGGATCNGVPIEASRTSDLDRSHLLAARPTFAPEHWTEIPRATRHFRTSLAYRLSLVGEGRFDGMLTLRPTWEWDIAAGALIATEGGAAVTDRHGSALRFNSPERQTAGVLAASPGVHGQARARLR